MRTRRRSSGNPAVASLHGLWSTAREASSRFASYVSSAVQFGNSRITRLVFSPAPLYRSEEHTSELQSLTNLVCRLLLERSEEHTSELQSLTNLVCRLLLEKK